MVRQHQQNNLFNFIWMTHDVFSFTEISCCGVFYEKKMNEATFCILQVAICTRLFGGMKSFILIIKIYIYKKRDPILSTNTLLSVKYLYYYLQL